MENFIKKGDIIVFDNKHKLFCGDCTKENSYNFMNKEIATMCFTSHPYNANRLKFGNAREIGALKYIDKETDTKSDEDYLFLINNSLKNSLKFSKYTFWNTAHSSGEKDDYPKDSEQYADLLLKVKSHIKTQKDLILAFRNEKGKELLGDLTYSELKELLGKLEK